MAPNVAANVGAFQNTSRQRNDRSKLSGYHTQRPSNKIPTQQKSAVGPNATRNTAKDPVGGAPQTGPILKSQLEWQNWPELTIRISNLPQNITTWELWKRFETEGAIVFIEIYENRQGVKDGCGKICFKPPPRRAFWDSDVIVPTLDGEGSFQVRVEPERKKRRFEIQSPVRKTIWYPELMVIHPTAMDFGFMLDERTIMKMCGYPNISRNGMSFRVDLLRMRIKVHFEVSFMAIETSDRGQELDRLERYMFDIPFGQLENIYHMDVSETQWALMISLDSPPQFFRKRRDIEQTHSDDALIWTEFNTWFRQTDIVYDPRRLKTAVLSLNKEVPVIDIGIMQGHLSKSMLTGLGRWTTYRFLFNNAQVEPKLFDDIRGALQDWNIEMISSEKFTTCPGRPASIWDIMDPPGPKSGKFDLRFLDENDGLCLLPFDVRYQLEVCISQGILNEYNISPAFVHSLADLAGDDLEKAKYILKYISERGTRVYDPVAIFEDQKTVECYPKAKVPHYCAYARKATVTPTMIYYSTPAVETSNRVIRRFSDFGDRFLRVQFTGEKFDGRINSCADISRNDELFTRVYRTLNNGIRIGDRLYQFLAFGNSQFRENGAYFFCSSENLSCADIRQWMGTFDHIFVVAKYAARLGLCFSTTRAIHSSGVQIEKIKDIERNGHCFTDGIGKISQFLAKMVASELGLPSAHIPSAFQFRMGGCKGILAVWPEAKGREVHIRPSQEKFRANYYGLEIIRCSQYSSASLNRQTITILSSLGVPDEVFNRMLSEQLSNYQFAMTDSIVAMELLGRYIDDNHMTIAIASMISNGFMTAEEPFLMSLLHLWRSWSIKLLKEKAKIIVEKGAFLLGCIDETGTLQGYENPTNKVKTVTLPQIFLQISDKKNPGKFVIIEGICILGRNPSLHPGDIRVVEAVNCGELHHLCNVVVFPQQGYRDIPSMCSGGDLDGDDFFIIWDQNLIPDDRNIEPMNYLAPKAKELDRLVEIEDLMKFFVKYMKNDALPTIAHAHLAQSDYLELGVKDKKCLELAELHSKAVDYVKTGVSAKMPKHLRPRLWPHFMEKNYKPKEQIYNSPKILGQLYDKVERVNFIPQYEEQFDQRILKAYERDDVLLKKARQIKSQYDTAMRRLMAQHEIKTEFEIWSTFVLSKPRVGTDYKIQEDMAFISAALKDRFRRTCIDYVGGKDFKDLGPFVAAMYRVTWEEMGIALHDCRTTKTVGGREIPMRKMEPKYMPLMSFPWLFHEVLGRIATGIEARDDLEDLGLTFATTRIGTQRQGKTGAKEDSDSDDFVITADGVTHRGEVLDLFRPDDIDSEGERAERTEPYLKPAEMPGETKEFGIQELIQDTELDRPLEFYEAKNSEQSNLIELDDLEDSDSDTVGVSLKHANFGGKITPEQGEEMGVPDSLAELEGIDFFYSVEHKTDNYEDIEKELHGQQWQDLQENAEQEEEAILLNKLEEPDLEKLTRLLGS